MAWEMQRCFPGFFMPVIKEKKVCLKHAVFWKN